MAKAYQKYRRVALGHDPHCQRCGAEHGPGHMALHWHHLQPQHTGRSEHSNGVLLCGRCHRLYHSEHKVVELDGSSKQGVPTPQRNSVRKRKAKATRISEAWSN